jgi:hypothetical protein
LNAGRVAHGAGEKGAMFITLSDRVFIDPYDALHRRIACRGGGDIMARAVPASHPTMPDNVVMLSISDAAKWLGLGTTKLEADRSRGEPQHQARQAAGGTGIWGGTGPVERRRLGRADVESSRVYPADAANRRVSPKVAPSP